MSKSNQAIGKAIFETLEGRELMSASAQLLGDGVLNITGVSNKSNNITVSLTDNGTRLKTTVNGASKYFDSADVHGMSIVTGRKADKIAVAADVDVNTFVNAGEGNDHISLGAGNDTVVASSGNDTMSGGAGKDQLTGGTGNDSISGNDGDDRLDGGGGTNIISGGAGNDTVLNGTDVDATAPVITANNSGGDTSVPPVISTGGGTTGTTTTGGTTGTGSTGSTDTGGTSGGTTDTGGSTNTGGTTDTGGSTGGGSTDTGGGDTNVSDGTHAVVELLENSVTAGNAIHAKATSSVMGVGGVQEGKYEWDFGDPNGKYNSLVGFNAAHVYDTAGTYTITLKVTDKAGVTSTATATVNIAADNRRTIYVSQSGNDANSGLSSDQAIKSLARAQQLLSSNTKILFRRGDQWDTSGGALTIGFTNTMQSNILIGAYGDNSAANPILRYTGTTAAQLINMKAGFARDIMIQDLTFDSNFAVTGTIANKTNVNAIKLAGVNDAVRRCTFLNLDTAVNGALEPTGVLVQDNVAPLPTGLRMYLIWGEGSDYVALGNTDANSTREHGMRFAWTNRILIAYNNITNLDRRSVDTADYNKKTIVLQDATYAYVARNHLSDGPLDIGTAMTVNSTAGLAERGALSKMEYGIFEDNVLDNTHVNIEPNSKHIMIRNNVINSFDRIIDIEGSDPLDATRTTADVQIINNTGVTTGTGGAFIYATSGASGITVLNNLYETPHNTRPVAIRVADSGFGMFSLIDQNVWPGTASNYAKSDAGAGPGYVYESTWDAYGEVGDDTFQTVSIPTGGYSATIAGVTVGAKLAA